jgi:hypothetical protein
MSPLSKGSGRTASSDVQGSATRGEAAGPIGSQFQFSTPVFRGGGSQESRRWEDRQRHATGPAKSKKRKTDSTVAEAFSGYTGFGAAAGGPQDAQVYRAEMKEEIERMQMQLM